MESWKSIPIDGFTHYSVSSIGRVRNDTTGSILTEKSFNRYGYRINTLCSSSGCRKTFTNHSLVALAFIGERPLGLHVCHNDGDKLNNSPDNLRYDTAKANMLDRLKHGWFTDKSFVSKRVLKNIDTKQARIIKKYLIDFALEKYNGKEMSLKRAANSIGLTESALCRYVNGSRGKKLENMGATCRK